jgi:hypothetical protein
MMTLNDRQPIIVADTGPLIRLAAAGLLDSIRGLNRRIVIVDRVEAEATADMSKPFADTIKLWLEDMGNSIERKIDYLRKRCAIAAKWLCGNSRKRGSQRKRRRP